MKHLLAPLTAFVLIATGYSLNAAGWFHPDGSRPAEVRRTVSDSFASDAAFRHRTGQPHHWRAMLMVK